MKSLDGSLLGAIVVAVSLVPSCKDPTEGKVKATVAPVKSVEARNTPSGGAEVIVLGAGPSRIEFVGAKVTKEHEGSFEKFDGKLELVGSDPEKSSVELVIDVASLQIEPAKLEAHLLSADFFEVEKFPKAKFVTTAIKKGGARGASHTVTGNLELHGVTQSISFPATIVVASDKATAKAEFGINRQDFGIVYPGAPDDLIKDEVLIRIYLEAPRKTPA